MSVEPPATTVRLEASAGSVPAERTQFQRWVLAAAAASALLRLRFLLTPLSVDEAGSLLAARAWGRGQHLYVDLFIDRPQGLIWAFQRWDALPGTGPSSVRILAVLAGAAAVICVGAIGRLIGRTWQAGAAAAWIAAVTSASPAIEGYEANGELLAAGFTVSAMAVGAAVAVRRLPTRWMFAAGVLAGLGISMKQTGYDVALALVAWIALAHLGRWRPRPEIRSMAGSLLVGIGVVVGGLALHGTTFGWDAYRYALFGFRLHARSVAAGGQWRRLAITTAIAAPLLGPPLALAARRGLALPRGGWRAVVDASREGVLLVTWVGAAATAFLLGGNYHRHYWITLTFPLAATIGTLAFGERSASATPTPASLRAGLARALAIPLLVSLVLVAAPRLERDHRVDADAALARWVRTEHPDPDERLLVLCGSATFYVDAHQAPPFPYLWVDHVRAAHGAVDQLAALLGDEGRPAFVALQQQPAACDRSGRIARALDRHYHPVAVVAGVTVLEDDDLGS